ncbi:hypothetical protein [Tellurirhabdus bombi]|uniref:hypothetical protein n=1 Tax=Tellurirhabdus bombi TaxID=2907205 RepID=UPI001F2032B8|nr:hypothetical protein [Tellurirhabdus bombi]
MKAKEFLKILATRAGIADTDANLTAFLDKLADIDADDDLAKQFTTNLITEKEAENRPTIKAKFTAQALNGVDALIDADLAEFLTPEEIEAVKKEEKSTMKKISKILAKGKELKASNKPADKAQANDLQKQYNEEIEKLKASAKEIETKKDAEIEGLKKQHVQDRFNDRLAAKILTRTDVVDAVKSFDGLLGLKALEKTLEKVGGQIDYSTGKLVQTKNPELALYVDNKEATLDGLLDMSLKDNDYLKKSDPAPSTTVVTKTEPAAGSGQISEAQRRNAERLKAA